MDSTAVTRWLMPSSAIGALGSKLIILRNLRWMMSFEPSAPIADEKLIILRNLRWLLWLMQRMKIKLFDFSARSSMKARSNMSHSTHNTPKKTGQSTMEQFLAALYPLKEWQRRLLRQ